MSGRPFLRIPGPTNVPERVLRAMDRAVGHLGALEVLATLGGVEMALRECGHAVAAGAGVAAAEERFLTPEKTVEPAMSRA